MSKKSERKRQELFGQCSSAIKSLTGVSGEFCICPLCGQYFTRQVLVERRLTLEHVPPKCIGGKEFLLTCSECNSTAGHKLDSTLHVRQRYENFVSILAKRGGTCRERIKLQMGDEILNFDFVVDHSTGGGHWFIPAGNDPQAVSRWQAAMEMYSRENLWDGQQLKVSLVQGFNRSASEVADLRIAYLLAFAAFGYRYALDERLDPIRRQLATPVNRIIQGFHTFLGWGISRERMLIITTEPIESLLVCLGSSVVLLPWLDGPFSPSAALSELVGKEEKIQFVGNRLSWPNQLVLELDFIKLK